MIKRRTFLQGLLPVLAASFRRSAFLFRVRGKGGVVAPGSKLGRMNIDGTGFEVLDFGLANQTGFGPTGFFRDGRRVIINTLETSDDWKTRPFAEYIGKSRSHTWIWDMESGKLTEILTKQHVALRCPGGYLLPGEDRILAEPALQVYVMNLDGTNQVPITRPDEKAYASSPSPDGKRIAFHANYLIYVAGVDGANRVLVAGGPQNMMYFGTSWSPDGEWVLYQVCDTSIYPGHDWSDIWIARPDGSEHRALTKGDAALFAAAHGSPDNPGGGSNQPKWAPDGSGILYSRRHPGSKLPWEWLPGRAHLDHFGRVFKPEAARGGAEIVCINPKDGSERVLTHSEPPQWDFRADWSSDRRQILFCRAGVGEDPAIWVMDRDGRNQRMLTRGINNQGADHPHWVP
jgi:Tol biopolymer transport system component